MSGRFRSSGDYNCHIVRAKVRTLTAPQRAIGAGTSAPGAYATQATRCRDAVTCRWLDGCPPVAVHLCPGPPVARVAVHGWLSRSSRPDRLATQMARDGCPGESMAVPGTVAVPAAPESWLSQRPPNHGCPKTAIHSAMAVQARILGWLSWPPVLATLFFLATSRPLAKNPRMPRNPSR